MSLEEIKRAIAELSPEEQRHIAAWLSVLRQDPAEEAEIDRALSNFNPADWMTLEQLTARLKNAGVEF